MTGVFIISLDFELMWGVRDHLTKEQYGRNVLGAREAIPRMLQVFEQYGICATWATVGFLFCESKDELIASIPREVPKYDRPELSNYNYFGEVGPNERRDPYYFGLSLLNQIRSCPGQEIGTHTFSHFYCLESGITDQQFEADLLSAIMVAERRGIRLRSLVFPRNQYDSRMIAVCARNGIRVYRGNEEGWMYRSTSGERQTLARRGMRLSDAYLNLSGTNTSSRQNAGIGINNIPSSRFLRPYSPYLRLLDGLRLSRITKAMEEACRLDERYHLWWHPHNFGARLEDNMRFLEKILDHFTRLRDAYGMRSLAMGDLDGQASK